jgi:putative N-acetylmannosamine-6-phosphate epimerase
VKPDFEDINSYEDVYDMKKIKEEVGIPLYPIPKSSAPAANPEANAVKKEIEKLQSKNEDTN